VPISNLPLSLLRRRLITIPQDYLHIPGSLRLSLDPWGLSTDAQIEQSLRVVHLSHLLDENEAQDEDSSAAHDNLAENAGRPAPLDRDLDPAALSHGQRQLLAAARATLQRAAQRTAVLLLDEAAGALDGAAEAAFAEALLGAGAGSVGEAEVGRCTVVCVSHRPATILAADVVVVMDSGEVVEVGPPGELMRADVGRLQALLGRSAFQSGW
jgi:ATP-binding cassette subfamily C (CFTR/MRP) protein 1